MKHIKIFYILTGFMFTTLVPIEVKASICFNHSNEPYRAEDGKNGSPGYLEDGENGWDGKKGKNGQDGGHGGNGGGSVYGNGGNGGNGGDVD